ncbi:hypothetical protein J2Z40_001200 [Cytobacillus eiseniae]|uniref:Uncharacterized protein n=1 Tax=Cytobacillus eiseniae TaxID=762947 RepID=A0ABS4RCL8_9BACI|nr:hypothetical protein [Cytobacillus eiseniae]MBP2240643.1 hypothetical protein [Cytobacillus eiseniae]
MRQKKMKKESKCPIEEFNETKKLRKQSECPIEGLNETKKDEKGKQVSHRRAQ